MTEQTDRKAQHRLRAQLLREGTRTLAAATITDYRQAVPTHKPKPTQTMIATAEDGTSATIEVTDVKVIRDARPSTYAEAISHATTPKPLPRPDTAAGLLTRLNARHQL